MSVGFKKGYKEYDVYFFLGPRCHLISLTITSGKVPEIYYSHSVGSKFVLFVLFPAVTVCLCYNFETRDTNSMLFVI